MTWLTDPVAWWFSPFAENGIMRDALLGSLFTVVATSIVGTWVVLRGLTFLGDALAQGVLPGIAIAWALSVNPQIGALVAAFVMVSGVNIIRLGSKPLPLLAHRTSQLNERENHILFASHHSRQSLQPVSHHQKPQTEIQLQHHA